MLICSIMAVRSSIGSEASHDSCESSSVGTWYGDLMLGDRGQDALESKLHHLVVAALGFVAELVDEIGAIDLAPFGEVLLGVFAIGVLVDALGIADFAGLDLMSNKIGRAHSVHPASRQETSRNETPPGTSITRSDTWSRKNDNYGTIMVCSTWNV